MESKKGYSLVVGRDKENEQGEEIWAVARE